MNRPILFNTEMVQAIREGRKTQTRRVCKGYGDCNPVQVGYHPPFKPGDILWVRETWQHVYNFDDGDQLIEGTGRYVYYADNPMPFDYWVDPETGEHKEQMPWKPSIHMPKEAARLFLRVKDVRVERLLDITEEDAVQEGCYAGYRNKPDPFSIPNDTYVNTSRDHFFFLWESTVKPADRDVYGINGNPWVWVIEFERCEKPEGWDTRNG